jgi:two-component system response regulator HydG
MEVQAVRQALEQCGGNKSNAAKMLGFSRKSLYKRLREFGIS